MVDPLMMFRLFENGQLDRTACSRLSVEAYAKCQVFVVQIPHPGWIEMRAYRRLEVEVGGVLVSVQRHRSADDEDAMRTKDVHRWTCEHSTRYSCMACKEMFCMQCDASNPGDEYKTAVQWCPACRQKGLESVLVELRRRRPVSVIRSVGKKLTASQNLMLLKLRSKRDVFEHLHGMSQRGGGATTLASLIRHGLCEVVDNNFTITARGRTALRTGRIAP